MTDDIDAHENDLALRAAVGGHAHSDIAIPLDRAIEGLCGVQKHANPQSSHPTVGYSINGRIFAYAEGMQHVTLRLPEPHATELLAVSERGHRSPYFESGLWINQWPYDDNVDLKTWVRLAYDGVR